MSFSETDWDHVCPWCGRTNEAASGPEGRYPDDGDWLVCWRCRQPSVAQITPYGLVARMPTADELVEIRAHPDFRAAMAAISEAFTPEQAASLLRERRD